jgi:hypothetical protein
MLQAPTLNPAAYGDVMNMNGHASTRHANGANGALDGIE